MANDSRIMRTSLAVKWGTSGEPSTPEWEA